MWDSLTTHTSGNATMEQDFWEEESNSVRHGSFHDE
jgi:D-tyrosyl-tRNA(Tyr) deacylase